MPNKGKAREVNSMDKINIAQKLSSFADHWSPKVIGELNGQQVKLVKLRGAFVWHKHDNEDELFYVLEGCLQMEFRDKTVTVNSNECIIVPRGVEHRPVAPVETAIMLFEPAATINTGNVNNEFTKTVLDRL
jgi:mannose-6-phosphate isomerase-like protein (cupin superfamily)